jgi:hypothetical protein
MQYIVVALLAVLKECGSFHGHIAMLASQHDEVDKHPNM